MKTAIIREIPCIRCNGRKFMSEFEHVNLGRCFLCNGTGFITKKQLDAKINPFQGQIDKYDQKGFPPENLLDTCKKVLCLSFDGHATAQEWLLFDGENFIKCQPICRSSTWSIIPKNEILEYYKNIIPYRVWQFRRRKKRTQEQVEIFTQEEEAQVKKELDAISEYIELKELVNA